MTRSFEVVVTYNHLPAAARALPKVMAELVSETTRKVAWRATNLMEQPKHGRIYAISDETGRPMLHQASAPGEAPAPRSYELYKSIAATPTVRTADGASGSVIADSPYGAYLEYGTTNMAPRPFMSPAAEHEWPEMVRAARAELSRRWW